MVTTTAKPLTFQAANTCSVCGAILPHIETPEPEVSIRGKRQRVVAREGIGGIYVGSRIYKRIGDIVPVVCVEVRK